MPDFVTTDSGKRDEFESGYRRDTQAGKPRYDLIPTEGLTRLADLYARGAEKYGEFNWQLGSPFRRTYASLLRHCFAWAAGDRTEDHLAAVAWNAFTLMFYEDSIKRGTLPTSLNDMGIPLKETTNVATEDYSQDYSGEIGEYVVSTHRGNTTNVILDLVQQGYTDIRVHDDPEGGNRIYFKKETV